MKKTVTWFLLADGAHAKIVTRAEGAPDYSIVFSEDSTSAHERSHDLGTDRPGHSQESSYSGRHAIEPKHDLHRSEEARFVGTVAAHVNREAVRGSFDRLTIYAAPRVLALLRQALEPKTLNKVHGEFAKDLTKIPLAALPAHFGTA